MNINIAARAARWSGAHWKTALGAWLAFCVVAVALGSVAGTKMLKQADTAAGGSGKAERILRDAGFTDRASESVLVQSPTRTVSDPAFRAAVADVVRTVSGLPQVQRVRSPLTPANSGQVSADRHSALVQFEIRGELDKADKKVQPILDAVDRAQRRHADFKVAEFGFASATHELNDTLSKDFKRAEYSSIPVTLAILLVAFGALVAAGLPVLLAFSGVLATIGLGGAREPRRRRRRRDQVGDPADRDGGRGRLLALLPPPRAGGAEARSFAGGGAEARGRHLRPRRLHLGADGADRDGRDALHRQRRLHVDRGRRDADGRGRADRLALDPARAALEARPPGRQGPDPAARAALRRRVAALGLRARPRPAPAGARGGALGRRARRARACRR